MARINKAQQKRHLLRLVQDGRCLLCPFPLALHLHHIIAHGDAGPDHPLNLAALCPNHHALVECVRQHIAPQEVRRDTGWCARAEVARDLVATLSDSERAVFDVLSRPHKLRAEVGRRDEVHGCVRKDLQSAFARDLAREDARMLVAVHELRPNLVHVWRQANNSPPLDMSKISTPIVAADFSEVIKLHLSALYLPFEEHWLES